MVSLIQKMICFFSQPLARTVDSCATVSGLAGNKSEDPASAWTCQNGHTKSISLLLLLAMGRPLYLPKR